ncbi:MAG: PKD domain-containing protein [Patescibacteria group bacterium]
MKHTIVTIVLALMLLLGCAEKQQSPIAPEPGEPLTVQAFAGSNQFLFGQSTNLSAVPQGGVRPYTYAWRPMDEGTDPTTDVVRFSPNGPGTFVFWVTVTDSIGNTATDSVSLLVYTTPPENQAPELFVHVSPTYGLAGKTTVYLSTNGSYDPEGGRLAHLIAWGDGTTITSAIGTHVYAQVGLYRITIAATDTAGVTTATDRYVQIGTEPNSPPVAVLTATPAQALLRQTVEFNAEQSSDPETPPGQLLPPYTWDFGDGTTLTTETPLTQHAYTMPGAYLVQLTVTDDKGAFGTDYALITISGAADSSYCWDDTAKLTVHNNAKRRTGLLENPSGTFYLVLTLRYRYDPIVGFSLIYANGVQVVYAITDPDPTRKETETYRILIPVAMYMETNMQIALTYQSAYSEAIVTLQLIEGCTEWPTNMPPPDSLKTQRSIENLASEQNVLIATQTEIIHPK